MERVAEDTLRELKRLNESLAEQNAFLRKSVQDRRLQDEAITTSLREMDERMSEIARADPGPARRPRGRVPPAEPRRRSRASPIRPPARRPPDAARAARAVQPGLRRLRPRQLRPRHPGVRGVPARLSRDRPLRQRAVLDRGVPVLEAEVRGGARGLGRAVPPLSRLATSSPTRATRRARPSSAWAGAARPSSSTARSRTAIPTRRRAARPARSSTHSSSDGRSGHHVAAARAAVSTEE